MQAPSNTLNLQDHLIKTRSKLTCLLFMVEAIEQCDDVPLDVMDGIFGLESSLSDIKNDLITAINNC